MTEPWRQRRLPPLPPLPLLPLLPLLVWAACATAPDTSPGVSWSLAQHRARTLSEIRYELTLRVPAALEERIHGLETVTVSLSDASQPLVLDFTAPEGSVLAVTAFGTDVEYDVTNGHLVIPASALKRGQNVLEIEFHAGDGALNRREEFFYSLFVPDRASSAFPNFDQPNLKATYQLTLIVPSAWEAVANTPVVRVDTAADTRAFAFDETKPLSTYLFAFAAGKFAIETAERDGRAMRMYHRETDTAKVERNREAIFDLHAAALNWLEEYTGIPYPFGKFDFVLIPSFQYGGMEHPGSILYRAASLLLDESATQNQLLGRASVIAHETAHMWFGDLVTMQWFNDVWMKEVFANFMAAKIVNPSFPEINHDLRFFLAHYPGAYGVDRTAGANPIRQELDNLNEAGALYGAIIYQKAPVVMRHLELLTGADTFRDGLRDYLASYQFANATWPDLIAILDRRSEEDLVSWSRIWVGEPGRPTVTTEIALDDARVASLIVTQSDPLGRGLSWNEWFDVHLGYGDTTHAMRVHLDRPRVEVSAANGLPAPDFVLAGGDALGYGHFRLDSASQSYLLQRLPSVRNPLVRSVAWMSLWEAMLEGTVPAHKIVGLALRALPAEPDELNAQRILGYLRAAYWRFLPPDQRNRTAPDVEALLWEGLEQAGSTSLKAAYFNTYASVALTDAALVRLERVWRKELAIAGLPLAERHYTNLARELALREVPNAEEILRRQLERITNPDRRARFEFVRPALSKNVATRDSFFEHLKDPKNREQEPWVVAGVSSLHHPLKAAAAVKHIRPSLELLVEIQATGDIFFPLRWLNATLGGHRSPEAAAIVRQFLDEHPNYPERLRGKILQAADGLFRAAEMEQG